MPKKETENQQRIITFEGIQYIVLKLGGFGVSRGMNSVIEAFDGEKQRETLLR